MTKEIEEKVKAFIGKAEYDIDGNQIVGIDENGGRQLLLDVRGWGAIQNLFKDNAGKIDVQKAAQFQDNVAEFIVVAINKSLLTQPADVQERAKVNTNRGHSTNDNVRESKVPESDAAHLAGASSLQAENERLRENYQSLSGKYDYLLEENERLNSVLKALNKQ